MQLAWKHGFHHLQVESDSKTLVDMITGKININDNLPTLVRRIHELLKLNWQVQFNHTWREGNMSADWLANLSFSMDSLIFMLWILLLVRSLVSFLMIFLGL